MSKEMEEKLVEEITDRICDVCDVNEYDVPLEEPIKWAITRIGKAYADGLPLPGEDWERFKSIYGETIDAELGLASWARNRLRDGARTFIALSGTGKEEE